MGAGKYGALSAGPDIEELGEVLAPPKVVWISIRLPSRLRRLAVPVVVVGLDCSLAERDEPDLRVEVSFSQVTRGHWDPPEIGRAHV